MAILTAMTDTESVFMDMNSSVYLGPADSRCGQKENPSQFVFLFLFFFICATLSKINKPQEFQEAKVLF